MTTYQQQKIDGACLILAGGKGRRLTPEKPLLKIHGRPIIERVVDVVAALFSEVFIITNTPERYTFLGLPMVPDLRPGCGPLMGIYSGLQQIKSEAAFVCAADMPFLDPQLIRSQYEQLTDFDIVVPWPNKRPEFLHAFYRKRCLEVMAGNLESDQYRMEELTDHCKTLRLEREWYKNRGLEERTGYGFTNINTLQEYRQWSLSDITADSSPKSRNQLLQPGIVVSDPLHSCSPELTETIRKILTKQESSFEQQKSKKEFSSLWAHSSRVGRIAHRIAVAESMQPEPALLAGLFHDIGKFAQGKYHEDDVTEEENAVQFIEKILAATKYEKWIPTVIQAVTSMFLEDDVTSDIGRAIYDADRLDKLGHMGVAQFFTKAVLRQRFLDEKLMIRASIELTYAHHAPQTLKTATGRRLARQRRTTTRQFFNELLGEWQQLGLGDFTIRKEKIAGVDCIFVVPVRCLCDGLIELKTDIEDGLKCRSASVTYICGECGREKEFSFCLPRIKGLPLKFSETEKN